MITTLLALAAAAPLHFDCLGPVAPRQSAAVLLSTYGKDARREDIAVPGGKTAKGVVLYPDDPARRLDITFWDDAQTAVQSVTMGPKASAWSGPLGLRVGWTIPQVMGVNGHNFSLTGLGWPYGGYILNFWSGKLLTLPGGCVAQVRFALPAGAPVPKAIAGEKELYTTMAPVKAADLRVDLVSIGWPLPAGVKVAN